MPDSQPNKNIYNEYEKFISSLGDKNWIYLYIFFEIELIKELGYDTNLTNFNNSNDLTSCNDLKIDDIVYEVPNYLTKRNIPENLSNSLIKKSLIFTRKVFVNKFFLPNSLIFPKSRIIFENYFN